MDPKQNDITGHTYTTAGDSTVQGSQVQSPTVGVQEPESSTTEDVAEKGSSISPVQSPKIETPIPKEASNSDPSSGPRSESPKEENDPEVICLGRKEKVFELIDLSSDESGDAQFSKDVLKRLAEYRRKTMKRQKRQREIDSDSSDDSDEIYRHQRKRIPQTRVSQSDLTDSETEDEGPTTSTGQPSTMKIVKPSLVVQSQNQLENCSSEEEDDLTDSSRSMSIDQSRKSSKDADSYSSESKLNSDLNSDEESSESEHNLESTNAKTQSSDCITSNDSVSKDPELNQPARTEEIKPISDSLVEETSNSNLGPSNDSVRKDPELNQPAITEEIKPISDSLVEETTSNSNLGPQREQTTEETNEKDRTTIVHKNQMEVESDNESSSSSSDDASDDHDFDLNCLCKERFYYLLRLTFHLKTCAVFKKRSHRVKNKFFCGICQEYYTGFNFFIHIAEDHKMKSIKLYNWIIKILKKSKSGKNKEFDQGIDDLFLCLCSFCKLQLENFGEAIRHLKAYHPLQLGENQLMKELKDGRNISDQIEKNSDQSRASLETKCANNKKYSKVSNSSSNGDETSETKKSTIEPTNENEKNDEKNEQKIPESEKLQENISSGDSNNVNTLKDSDIDDKIGGVEKIVLKIKKNCLNIQQPNMGPILACETASEPSCYFNDENGESISKVQNQKDSEPPVVSDKPSEEKKNPEEESIKSAPGQSETSEGGKETSARLDLKAVEAKTTTEAKQSIQERTSTPEGSVENATRIKPNDRVYRKSADSSSVSDSTSNESEIESDSGDDENILVCDCNRSFSSMRSLIKHIRFRCRCKEVPSQDHYCGICQTKHQGRKFFNHIEHVHSLRSLRDYKSISAKLSERRARRNNLYKDCNEKQPPVVFFCLACDVLFTIPSDTLQHLKLHRNQKTLSKIDSENTRTLEKRKSASEANNRKSVESRSSVDSSSSDDSIISVHSRESDCPITRVVFGKNVKISESAIRSTDQLKGGTKFLVCIYCQKKLFNIEDAILHKRQCHRSDQIEDKQKELKIDCKLCGANCTSYKYIEEHFKEPKPVKKAEDVRVFLVDGYFETWRSCQVCDTFMSSTQAMKIHNFFMHQKIRSHSLQDQFQDGSDSRGRPEKVPTKVSSFRCLLCKLQFLNFEALKTHIEVFHLKGIVNNCPVCLRYNNSLANLCFHLFSAHSIDFPTRFSSFSFKCDLCNLVFLKRSEFEVHIESTAHLINVLNQRRKGGTTKPVVRTTIPTCKVCSQTFWYNSEVENHMKIAHSKSSQSDKPEPLDPFSLMNIDQPVKPKEADTPVVTLELIPGSTVEQHNSSVMVSVNQISPTQESRPPNFLVGDMAKTKPSVISKQLPITISTAETPSSTTENNAATNLNSGSASIFPDDSRTNPIIQLPAASDSSYTVERSQTTLPTSKTTNVPDLIKQYLSGVPVMDRYPSVASHFQQLRGAQNLEPNSKGATGAPNIHILSAFSLASELGANSSLSKPDQSQHHLPFQSATQNSTFSSVIGDLDEPMDFLSSSSGSQSMSVDHSESNSVSQPILIKQSSSGNCLEEGEIEMSQFTSMETDVEVFDEKFASCKLETVPPNANEILDPESFDDLIGEISSLVENLAEENLMKSAVNTNTTCNVCGMVFKTCIEMWNHTDAFHSSW